MPRRIQDQSIVIVEDNAEISESLRDFFGGRNSVQTFGSAEEALAGESNLPSVNVFILDYKLPGKNGVELFHELRANFPAAKYILITGELSFEMADNTRKEGFDALMLKPFDYTILEDNIAGLLSTAS